MLVLKSIPRTNILMVQKSGYSSFCHKTLNYPETTHIKQQFFGANLEKFKQTYEAPISHIFSLVTQTKKKLGNHRAKKFIKKTPTVEKQKKLEKKAKLKKFIEKEKEIEAQMQNMVTNAKSMQELAQSEYLFLAETPEKRREREALLGFLFENFGGITHPQDDWGASKIPPRVAINQGIGNETYEFEKKLSDGELAAIIEKELQKDAIDLKSDYSTLLLNRMEQTNWQGTKFKQIINKMTTSGVPTLPDRPAVALTKKSKPKLKKNKLCKVSDLHPIAFETNTYPLDEDFYDPYHTRKVTMYVKLSALELPDEVRRRLIAISKHRDFYNSGKDLLIIKSQKKRTLRENKRYVVSLFQTLLNEAWKVDLNYIPGPETPEPHRLIQEEIENAKIKEETEYKQSFDRVKERTDWTLFRFVDLPPLEDWTKIRQESEGAYEQILNEIQNTERVL